jgi:glycine cleavage system H lipoate-binding protein
MSRWDDVLYGRYREWVKIEGDVATIGIADYAQNSESRSLRARWATGRCFRARYP